MSLFRRREPLHVRLAREGGVALDDHGEEEPRSGWDVAGALHGARPPREWDLVSAVEAPGLEGERAKFVALSREELLVEEGPDNVEQLAQAIERQLPPPYRAEGVHRNGTLWAVAARAIELATLPGVAGNEVELTLRDGSRTLVVDGELVFGSIPALERPEQVVRATRIDGETWEVRYDPL